ncbi:MULTISPECIES: hypothetical protein [Vibrio]|uniref:hypothetical protein n=1 Tax=Vibrio TaxID=662 RepID=UPI0010BE1281|nr:hypothetical protein [Vibrio sp. F12]TKE77641.1 hypothetical protein FCV54_19255 [Vibrio sp. F12]
MHTTTPIKKCSETNNLTLRLEHRDLRANPEDMLLALHCYTKGYRHFIELIGQQIEPDSESVFLFDHVERGSIKLINKVGYKGGVLDFIALQLTKLLLNDATEDNLEQKAQEIEQETSAFLKSHNTFSANIVDPYIDRISLAEVMNDISTGGEMLMDQEHFEVSANESSSSNKVYKFDPGFRSHISMADLKKSQPEPFNGKDTIIAIKPCNIGTGSWYVKSIISQRQFFVKIVDHEWLSKYQSGKMAVVRANDLIRVNLICDVVVSSSGNTRNANAIINHVHSVERDKFISSDSQANLFE